MTDTLPSQCVLPRCHYTGKTLHPVAGSMPSSSSRRSLTVPVSHAGRSHGVSNLYHHLCCGDLRSPVSAVPRPTCWAAWRTTEHTAQQLHRSGCSPSPRRSHVETRPVNNLPISDCVREMKSGSPTLNQKLGMQGRPTGKPGQAEGQESCDKQLARL